MRVEGNGAQGLRQTDKFRLEQIEFLAASKMFRVAVLVRKTKQKQWT